MLPASIAHVSRVRDAGAEPVRLSEAEQVLSAPSQVYPADTAAGAHGTVEAQGELAICVARKTNLF